MSMKNIVEQATEAEAAMNDTESLQKLGGIQRIKESTIGAIGNVLKGTGRLFKKGERTKGAAQIGQGILDALDVFFGAAADANRFVFGPKETKVGSGPSEYNYNISRAIGGAKDVSNPVEAIGVAGDILHAGATKLGSDGLIALRRNDILGSQENVRKQVANLDIAA